MSLRRTLGESLRHSAPLWRWTGGNSTSWFFVTIDGDAGEALSATALMRRLEGGHRPGWGSLKARVTIGESCWSTSVFPSKEQGWLLPIKAVVRKAEGIGEGDVVEVTLEV